MKITVGTIFLAVVVFLDSIELISSAEPVETTLAELFPEYERNGYLPPVKIFTNRVTTKSTAFTQIGIHILRRSNLEPHLLARGNVIFAWAAYDRSGDNDRTKDYIAPLWRLFSSLEHEKRWVFDTTGNYWVTLNQKEFDKLGFGYILTLVMMQQETARVHRLTTGNRAVDARAHNIAYLRANNAIGMFQAAEAEKLHRGQTTFVSAACIITRRYIDAYDTVFREIARDLDDRI